MNSNGKDKLPDEIIREAMKNRGIEFKDLADIVGERPDKLSAAVRCATGVGKRSIEMRRKAALALNLDPDQVWDASFLTARPRLGGGGAKVKPADKISKDAWAQMAPAARVRAILKQREIPNLQDLADHFEVTYRVLTSSIYGTTASDELREKIAAYLDYDPVVIWPHLYPDEVKSEVRDLSLALKEYPQLKTFLGFGDMTRDFSMCQHGTLKTPAGSADARDGDRL